MEEIAQVAACLENRISRQHTVNEQQALEVPVHRLGLALERLCIILATDRSQGASKRA